MDPQIIQQLIQIRDELEGLAFWTEMPLGKKEQAEIRLIQYLNKLSILAISVPELHHLAYPAKEAQETFDLEYILTELDNIIGD